MMSYLDTTCFFYIRERTKNEYVSIGSNGNILRWCYTGGNEQKWLIIPKGSDGQCKFMTRQNGEFMSVGSNGNILRWADGGSNEFQIVNQQPDGWFNIQEPTKREYVAVGSNGNILRWARTGGAEQQFKLEPVDIMPQPSLKKDEHWYYPSQIPNPPEVKGFDNDPPLKSQRYYISGQVLPAVLVNDPRYSDKLRQVEGSPYYTLKRYQQWSRSEPEGHGSLKTFTGASEHIMEVRIKTGMTTTQRQEVERVVSWNVAAQLKGSVSGGNKAGDKGGKEVTGSGEVGFQVGYSDTTTTRQWTETTITNETEVTERETYPPQNGSFRVAVWSLLDVYTLTDNQGKLVKEWSVIRERAKYKMVYPPAHKSGRQ